MSDSTGPSADPTASLGEDGPRAVAGAFAAAANAQDEAAALTTCTPAAWPALRGLFAQIGAKGLELMPFGASHRHGARAVVRGVLSKPGGQRPLGDLWLLLDGEAGWVIVGLCKPHAHASLYLRGALAADAAPDQLPPSAAAESWAAHLMADHALGLVPDGLPPELDRALRAPGEPLRLLGTAELPGSGRCAARLSLPEADAEPLWVVLKADGQPGPVGGRLSFDLLLSGVELPFPDPVGAADPPAERSRDQRDAEVRATVAEALRQLGAQDPTLPADDPRKVAAQRMLQLVDEALAMAAAEDPARRAAGAPAALAAAPPAALAAAQAGAVPDGGAPDGAPPAPFHLPPKMREAVEAYIADEVAAGRVQPGEVALDDAFLRAHGAGLTGALFKGFLDQSAPKGLSLDVPVPPAPGSAEPQKVTLTLDLGGLLGSLMKKGKQG
jgi:hypothetical protein